MGRIGRPKPRYLGNARDDRGRFELENLSVPAGAGARGTGGFYSTSIERRGGLITTRILIDITGLQSSTTDLDIIGVSTTPAHIGRIVAADNGTIIGSRMECLEAPVTGVLDIDLYVATEATGVFDGAIAALTETAVITSGGNWTLGRSLAGGADAIAANDYLYLCNGAAGTVGTYTAGRFLLTLFGR